MALSPYLRQQSVVDQYLQSQGINPTTGQQQQVAAPGPGQQVNYGGSPTMQIGQQLGGLGDLINSGPNAQTTPVAQGVNSGLQLAGMIPGPQQPFIQIASMLAPFIESFIPQGVPRDAKTQAIASALSGSPNQLQSLLGGLLNRGLESNQVLSQGGNKTLGGAVERTAGMLEALTGQQIPGVTGSGDFQHDPTLNFTKLFRAAGHNQLPAGYEFLQDPTGINTAFRDIQKMVGTQAPTTRQGQDAEWQKLMQQLIQQNVLQRYKGPLGSPTAGAQIGSGSTPTMGGLARPLQQQQGTAAPYPV